MSDSISTITPVYNDPEGIRDTITSLPLEDAQAEFIVIDNGSTDNTRSVIKEFEQSYKSVTLLHEPQENSQFAARNTAIRSTDNNILAFVDADMMLPEGWLSSVLEEFRRTEADFMANNVELTLPEDPTFWSRYDRHTGFPVEQYIEQQHFAPTCCLVIGRSIFEDIGLFDERLQSGGDKEFGTRAYDMGYEIEFTLDITMYHPTRNSFSELVSKASRVGRGHCQLQRCHPDRFGTPGIPPRPSGIKRPDKNIPISDRVGFNSVSQFLTGVRGLGYAREYISGDKNIGSGSIPRIES
jgi:GT2 family glycosyltransferase